MSTNEMPERWARRLMDKGFIDGRSSTPAPSMSALAAATGLHTTTISGLIHGRRTPTAETLNILVSKLGRDVADWLGMAYHGPWDPPAESTGLSPRQRRALEELIVSMTTEGGEARERGAAPTSKRNQSAKTQKGETDTSRVVTGRRGSLEPGARRQRDPRD